MSEGHFRLPVEKAQSCQLHRLLGETCEGCIAIGPDIKGRDSSNYVNCPCFGEPDPNIIYGSIGWSLESEALSSLLTMREERNNIWKDRIEQFTNGLWRPSNRSLENILQTREELRHKPLRASKFSEEPKPPVQGDLSKFLDNDLDYGGQLASHSQEGVPPREEGEVS